MEQNLLRWSFTALLICVSRSASGNPSGLAETGQGPLPEAPESLAPSSGAQSAHLAAGASPAVPLLPSRPLVNSKDLELMVGVGPDFLLFGPLSNNGGLSVVLPQGGHGSITRFGFNLGIGYLVNKVLEPVVLADLDITHSRDLNSTVVITSLAAGLRLNGWISKRIKTYAEVQAGELTFYVGNENTTFFRGGASVGGEWLIGGNWGLQVWTGVLVLYRDQGLYQIPVRWGFVGYF